MRQEMEAQLRRPTPEQKAEYRTNYELQGALAAAVGRAETAEAELAKAQRDLEGQWDKDAKSHRITVHEAKESLKAMRFKDERDAALAALQRVRDLADEWDDAFVRLHDSRLGVKTLASAALRAALAVPSPNQKG